MNPEVQASTHIMKVIGKHVDELDGCKHSIIEIMNEAFRIENEDKGGVSPTTGQHLIDSDNNPGSARMIIDYGIKRETQN